MFKFLRGLKDAFMLGYTKGVHDYYMDRDKETQAKQRVAWCDDFQKWYQTTESPREPIGTVQEVLSDGKVLVLTGNTPPDPCPECVYFFDGKNYWHQCEKEGPVFGKRVTFGGHVERLPPVRDNVIPFRPRPSPCLDPEKMNGYADQFPGSDYP